MAGYGSRGQEPVLCKEIVTAWPKKLVAIDAVSVVQTFPAGGKNSENILVQELKAAETREALLHVSLRSYKTRQDELLNEINAGKERERELLQQRTDLEGEVDQWKRMFNEALTSYQGVEEEITIKEREHAEAEQAMNAKLEGLQSQLAAKQTEGEELTVSPKDLQIVALQSQLAEVEKVKVGLEEGIKCASDNTVKVLWNVTQMVHALTVGVEESQFGNKYGCPTTSIRKRQRLEMPTTLASSSVEAQNMISCANSALIEAAKKWKKAQDGVEIMISCCREAILDRIVGRKEIAPKRKAALRDIPNHESQIVEQRPKR